MTQQPAHKQPLRIGVIGYSGQKFDTREARQLINEGLDAIVAHHPNRPVVVVSGLTALGVPLLAYEAAAARGWRTEGVACSLALDYDRWPVDHEIIVGANWSDESPTFLSRIDVLLRVGGGNQSHAEAAAFDGPTYEMDLEAGTNAL